MGCDIHLHVEKKINGKWQRQTGFISDYYDEDDPFYSSDEYKDSDNLYESRWYSLFAFLADVRNSRNITPLVDPRGLPSDISEGVKFEVEDWDPDAHHHSYLGLDELIEAEEIDEYKRFFDHVLPQLKAITDLDLYKDVRIVFWFDN